MNRSRFNAQYIHWSYRTLRAVGFSNHGANHFLIKVDFYLSLAWWALRQPWECAQGLRLGLAQAESTQLSVDPSPGQRAIFYVAFAIAAAREVFRLPLSIWQGAVAHRREWKARMRYE
jgi:hypothetical protein